jgi:hypothetical protein
MAKKKGAGNKVKKIITILAYALWIIMMIALITAIVIKFVK